MFGICFDMAFGSGLGLFFCFSLDFWFVLNLALMPTAAALYCFEEPRGGRDRI